MPRLYTQPSIGSSSSSSEQRVRDCGAFPPSFNSRSSLFCVTGFHRDVFLGLSINAAKKIACECFTFRVHHQIYSVRSHRVFNILCDFSLTIKYSLDSSEDSNALTMLFYSFRQCSECDKTSDSEPEVLEKKVPRRSRIRYSKDGAIITSPQSPSEPTPVPKFSDQKPIKLETPIKIATAANPIKVTIKPFEFSSENEALIPEMSIKREKKNKKKRDHVSTSEDHKKQHKRSFTSPALTNTPLMSITPIVADSPNDSHNENSNASTSAANQNFSAQNLSFSSLLGDKERDSKTIESSIENTLANLSSDIATYKANRKRRKEKHRNRYSPDLLRSPSKSHKHKRKKKNQDMENPAEMPHPRITIKVKPSSSSG